MIVGTILLTENNFYVKEDGSLPQRPPHDKQFLSDLCAGENVTLEGYCMLPKSIKSLVSPNDDDNPVPITIRELAEADLLIVSRSYEKVMRGKEFRLDKFKCILKDRKVELWKRTQKQKS